jgi:E3 ubiquitin-protein ligase DOA10
MDDGDNPDGTVCFICLDVGPDDEGKPLVRDCSCRGDAGVAHLSCLTMYAKQKSRKGSDKTDAFEG